MELLVVVIVAFLIGKAFGGKKNPRRDDWPDEPIEYTPPKKKGCFSRLLSLLFWGFVIIVFGAFVTSLGGDSADTSAPAPAPAAVVSSAPVDPIAAPTAAHKSEPTAVPTATPTAEPTASPTAEPATREDWVRLAAQEVYRDDLISVTWQEVDNQKDMIVIWCEFSDNFTNQMRRDGFMLDAKNMFKRIAQLGKDGLVEYGSCYIVGRTTYLDNYGNEFDGNAMEIRLKASDLAKINWDNVNSDMLVNLATTYAVHPLFRD